MLRTLPRNQVAEEPKAMIGDMSEYDDDCCCDFTEDEHGFGCDCADCELQNAMDECGRLPAHLGGGCQSAGSEYCEFECPFRDSDPCDIEE